MSPVAAHFVLAMYLPTFGGHVTATFRTADAAACDRLLAVITREVRGLRLRHDLTRCEPAEPADAPRRPWP
jgi:hypothetical protein